MERRTRTQLLAITIPIILAVSEFFGHATTCCLRYAKINKKALLDCRKTNVFSITHLFEVVCIICTVEDPDEDDDDEDDDFFEESSAGELELSELFEPFAPPPFARTFVGTSKQARIAKSDKRERVCNSLRFIDV